MTTRRAFQFEADLDISDVTQGLRRIEMQSRRAGAAVGRVGSGLGRGARGAGGVVGRGAGLGAGAAIFEQLIMKIFELFEDTPVLEEFIEALDEIFKAAGPVIGILLKSLTPVIKALTPAIEPLARAMVPLVELFGAGLLIAVELITPAIILFAGGLERVTTFIRDTALAGFRFIVEQLNKLPFVDIQVDLEATGGSFDAMAVQIETAGAMADDAAPAVAALATATDAEKIAADKAKTATDLWAQAARENEMAAKPLTTQIGILSDEMDEAYTATDSLGVIIGRTAPQVSALTTLYIAQNMAAMPLSRTMGILSDEMDEAYTATDNLGVIVGASKGPAVDLAAAIDQMTMDIEDAQAAADLNQAAFNGLTPELQAAALEMGLFRGEIVEVGKTVGEVAMGLGTAAGSIMSGSNSSARQRASGGIQTTSVFYDENGNLIGRSAFSGDEGGPASAGAGQRLFANSTGDLFYDADFINRAGDDFQGLADSMDITTEAVDNLDDSLTGNTLVDSLNAINRSTQRWDYTLENAVMANNEAERATAAATAATERQSDASKALSQIAAAGAPPISDLEALLARMIMTITDTAAAAELQAMAIALLPPGLRALAEEFGLFGLRLQEIEDDLPPLGSLTHRQAAFDPRLTPEQQMIEGRLAVQENNNAAMLAAALDNQNTMVNVIIDGAAVATATQQAQSEGAM